MKKSILLLSMVTLATCLKAQTPNTPKQGYYKIAVSNSHAAKPFGSLSSMFYKDFHPGLDIGYRSVLKNKKKHQWFLEGRASYMFHRWVQHNIALYADAGYRYAITSSWSAEIQLGGGYQLSIPDSKLFTITESEGVKKKKNFGRSQVIGVLGLGIGKALSSSSGTRVFMEYQQKIQAPFIKEYVPILPYNNLLLGIATPLYPFIKK
jgi:hypothetical protein